LLAMVGATGIVGGTESRQAPGRISMVIWEDTGGKEFLARILFVVISTEPVRERSYAIELGGRWGNIVCITWTSDFGR